PPPSISHSSSPEGTGGIKERKKRKRKLVQKNISDLNIRKQIKDIVINLLFNDKRKDINKKKQKKTLTAFNKTSSSYMMHCVTNAYPINLIIIQSMYDNVYNDLKLIPIIEYDLRKILHYVNIVFQFISLTLRVSTDRLSRANIQIITLAMLYAMTLGYSYNNIVLFPQDRFLAHALPERRDLDIIGIDKKHITKGNTFIEYIYAEAFSKHFTLDELQIKMTDIDDNAEPLMRPANYRKNKR
ncbi:unnamed protein product, partial [marine sediment metagenome]